MAPLIGAFVYLSGMCLLFYLQRDSRNKVSRVLWIPFITVLVSVSRPITFWLGMQTGSTPDAQMEGNPIDAAFALGLILVGIFALSLRGGAVTRLLKSNSFAIAYLSYCALSVTWSDYPMVAFKRWIRLLGTFIIVLLILTDADPGRAMRWVLTRAGFFLVPLSVMLIKYFPNLSRYYDPWTGVQYVSGVATDKNMLGMICLVTGLAVLAQFLTIWKDRKRRERTRQLVAYGVLLAATLWLFSSANSMTSLSCFCMGSFVLVALTFVKATRRTVAVHVLVAGVVGAAFSVLFLHFGESAALGQLGRDTTLSGRTEIWAGLLAFAGNPLVGTGFDSFWVGDRLLRIWAAGGLLKGINEAHNGYLETYLNLGWIGVALLAGLIVTGYQHIIRALRTDPEQGKLRLALFVVAIVYDFTEAGFRTGTAIWLTFLYAIWAVQSSRSTRTKSRAAVFPIAPDLKSEALRN